MSDRALFVRPSVICLPSAVFLYLSPNVRSLSLNVYRWCPTVHSLLLLSVLCLRAYSFLFALACFCSVLVEIAFIGVRLIHSFRVTVAFVGVTCDELIRNKHMAHSQIVVVIAFSLTFEMDVALVLHRRPFGNVGFHCRFFNRRLLSFVSVCV